MKFIVTRKRTAVEFYEKEFEAETEAEAYELAEDDYEDNTWEQIDRGGETQEITDVEPAE